MNEVSNPRARSRLVLGNGLGPVWEAYLAPWFRRWSGRAADSRHTVAVVTPSRAAADAVKARLVDEGCSLLGVQFWTSGLLRDALAACYGLPEHRAQREDLALLLGDLADADDSLHLGSATLLVHRLLDDWDRLVSCGCNAAELRDCRGRSLLERLEILLADSPWRSGYQIDRELTGLADRPRTRRLEGSLLLCGFGPEHWPLFALLSAAAVLFGDTLAVILEGAEDEADQAWVGSWEEILGPVELVLDETETESGSYRNLAEAVALGHLCPSLTAAPEYLIANHVREEAGAVVQRIVQLLCGDNASSTITVLVPENGVLGREIAALLGDLDIPHFDVRGHPWDQLPAASLLRAWADYQADPRLATFDGFLRQAHYREFISKEEMNAVEREWEHALRAVLTDDLRVVSAYLRSSESSGGPQRRGALFERWPLLPERDTLSRFGALAANALRDLGFLSEAESLLDRLKQWDCLDGSFSRVRFLDWFVATLSLSRRVRVAAGSHPFSRIWIAGYGHAPFSAATHLLVAGLNQGQWPGEVAESPFLTDDRAQALNREALATGSQGTGHLVVTPGKGYVLSAMQRRAIIMQRLLRAIERVPGRLVLAASLHEGDDFEKRGQISEFLQRIYYAHKGRILSGQALGELLQRTAANIARAGLRDEDSRAAADFADFGRIHRSRRDPESAFGSFDWAYGSESEGNFILSCGGWERFLKRPAGAWMEGILGLRPASDYRQALSVPLLFGTWIHSWIALAGHGNSVLKPAPDAWMQSTRASSRRLRSEVEAAYLDARRSLPDWWQALWREAAASSEGVARELGGLPNWRCAASEVGLPPGLAVGFENGMSLHLSGRMDLVLSTRPLGDLKQRSRDGRESPVWIIDIKTGGDESLKMSGLQRGDGVQIGLYGLALQALGFDPIHLSIVRPGMTIAKPIEVGELSKLQHLWEGLATVQESGLFGNALPLTSSFSFVGHFPIATLEIATEVLRQKWVCTHKALPIPG